MQKNKKEKKFSSKTLVAILMSVVLIVGFTFGYFFYGLTNREYKKYNEILKLVKEQGIEMTTNEYGEQLSSDEIAEILLNALLENDDYKEYYTEEELKALIQENKGNFSGFGFSLGAILSGETVVEDKYIARVVGNSPAMKAGLKAGDIIIGAKVLDDNLEEIPTIENREQLIDLINVVEENESVIFAVQRGSQTLNITVKKTVYNASYVVYADSEEKVVMGESKSSDYVLENERLENLALDTSYIRLDEFNGDAHIQFERALNKAYAKNRGKIILDLRNNGGGKLDVMLSIASNLIYNNGQKKSVVLVAKSKSAVQGQERSEVYSTSNNNFDNRLKNLVVLANQNTASASECLINALIYYGRDDKDGNFTKANNLVISKSADGTATTYGKGIMQTTFKLKTGGAVKLTTAKLYNPAGWESSCIHNKGFDTVWNNRVEDASAIDRAVALLADNV